MNKPIKQSPTGISHIPVSREVEDNIVEDKETIVDNDDIILKVRAKMVAEQNRRKEKNREDLCWFAENNVKVLPKDPTDGFIPFRLNKPQQIIHEIVEKQRADTGKVRVIVLKARQQGISTYFAARTYWRTTNHKYVKSMLLAHDQATTDSLFQMTKNITLHQPDEFRPKIGTSNKKELVLTELESSYKIYTAGSPQAGRGNTPTILHCSEVAFWKQAEDLISGLFNGVPNNKGTEIVLESTANGAQGEFYRLWKEAEAGKGSFIPIFLPWFITDEYVREVKEDFSPDPEEKDLMDKFDIGPEQIMFRREMISQMGEDRFKQEYPSTAEEAFLRSGRSVFDASKLEEHNVMTPVDNLRYSGSPRQSFDPDPYGHLNVWEYSGFEGRFIIGADVATGTGGDYSTAIVMDPSGNVCALFRDNLMDASLFGEMLYFLGRMYNNGLIVCERNGPGLATLNRLDELSYNNLYCMTRLNKVSKETTSVLGFQTTVATKPHIISGLAAAIRTHQIDIRSNWLMEELRNYIILENGRTEAAKGYHDDTVIAAALCIEGLRTHGQHLSKTHDWPDIEQDSSNWF